MFIILTILISWGTFHAIRISIPRKLAFATPKPFIFLTTIFAISPRELFLAVATSSSGIAWFSVFSYAFTGHAYLVITIIPFRTFVTSRFWWLKDEIWTGTQVAMISKYSRTPCRLKIWCYFSFYSPPSYPEAHLSHLGWPSQGSLHLPHWNPSCLSAQFSHLGPLNWSRHRHTPVCDVTLHIPSVVPRELQSHSSHFLLLPPGWYVPVLHVHSKPETKNREMKK